jgi:hypothetical protein
MIQGDGCRPRRRSRTRYPPLDPIRNPSESRGLFCRSCFGPRTCVRGVTNSSKQLSSQSEIPLLTPTMQAGQDSDGWVGGFEEMCTLHVGVMLCIVFVTVLPDRVDDSFTSTICLYLSPSQLCLIKRMSNFKVTYLNLVDSYCTFF